MTDYIDREEALEIALEGCSSELIHHDLKRLPFVNIITCKECKHRPYKNERGTIVPPNKEGSPCPCVNDDDWYYNWMPRDDFYCGNAEPKEADGCE